MRSRRSHCLLLLVAPLLARPALAGEGPYLGFEAGANFPVQEKLEQAGADAGKVSFDPGYRGGLVFGDTLSFGLRPEIELTYRANDVKRFVDAATGGSAASQGKVDVYAALLNLWYEGRDRDGVFAFVHPYFGGGVGGARVQFRDTDFMGPASTDDGRTLLAYQGGTGIGFDVSRFVTVSLDYRYLQTQRGHFHLDESDGRVTTQYRAHTIGASVRFSFAGSEYRAPVERERVRTVAAPPPRVYAPPVDSDGDGVPDDLDHCPGTPAGFKVDLNGCIIQQSVVLQAVEFDNASDRLTPSSRVTLDGIAAALQGQPMLSVEIDGYTDSTGSALANQRLSERRARSVLEYLVSRGVSRANLRAKGYGQARPIADNATPEGRAQNRRVEFQVLNTPPTVKVIEKKAPSPRPTRPVSPRRAPDDSSLAGPFRH